MDRFIVKAYDGINGNLYILGKFVTLDQATDRLFTEWNVGLDMSDSSKLKNNPLVVFENEGKLYCNWVTYNETDIYSLLFEEYTSEKPTTLKALRDYMQSGNKICLNWADRAPAYYWIYDVTDKIDSHDMPVIE